MMHIALDCSMARGGIGRGGNRFARSLEMAFDAMLGTASNDGLSITAAKFDLVHWEKHLDFKADLPSFSRYPGALKRALWDKGTMWKLGKLASGVIGTPDVVHTLDFKLVQVPKAKLVYSLLDLPWTHGFEYAGLLKPLIEDALNHADVVLAISRATAEDAIAWGVDPSKVKVMYSALDPVYTSTPVQPRSECDLGDYILFVGSCLSPNKNFMRIIKALEISAVDMPLIVVGPDDPSPMAVNSSLRVVYLGHVNESTLLSLYDHAAALVFPSLFEGFGYPLVEAMARGCPVVTSNSGALREVSGGAAILVDPYEVEDIAMGIESVLDSEKAKELITKGRTRVKDFGADRLSRDLMSAYLK